MTDSSLLTAEEFSQQKLDLPDGGRWSELVRGQVVTLQPPDRAHGTAVLNLSKCLAAYFQELGDETAGYACFELGLAVARNPDTVRCPPVSYFTGGERFSESDKIISDEKPTLVIEFASTPDRRQSLRERVEEYLHWGVQLVWVGDPIEQQVHVFRQGAAGKVFAEHETLIGSPLLSGFSMKVSEIFAEPDWWK